MYDEYKKPILIGFGGWRLWNVMLDMRQRTSLDKYGHPLMEGPYNPGGLTYGPGDRADLQTTYRGWGTIPQQDASDPQKRIIVGVWNRSERTWHNVTAEVALCDTNGQYLRTVEIPYGDLCPRGQGRLMEGPIDKGVAMFRVLGYKGK